MMGREKKSHLENNPTPVPQELGRILRLTATQRYCDGSSTLTDSRTGNQPRRAWGPTTVPFFWTGPQPEARAGRPGPVLGRSGRRGGATARAHNSGGCLVAGRTPTPALSRCTVPLACAAVCH